MQVAVQPAATVATFETLATPNTIKSKQAGRPVYDEMEVCRIRFAGNKQTVGVYPANEVFTSRPDENGIVQPVTYAMEFNDAYLKFKAGEAQTVAGTPLSELPFLTVGKRLELKALNIHTAESLAGLDGNNLKMLGMGGRELKNQAVAYLATASDTATTASLNEALERRDAIILDLQRQIDQLAGNAPIPAAGTTAPSPFDDYTEDDLKNWIADADPTTRLDGRWGREKLIETAIEINRKLAAKNAA